jgi:hypothetical protein
VLTRGAETRRIPYWLHVSARALARERHTTLRRTGTYGGNTRHGRSIVSSYRFPSGSSSLGLRAHLFGPEQVFRLIVRGRVANVGARVLSEARGVSISPRLVRAADEDRLAGYPGLPLRLNPYEPNFYGVEPVVGVFRPSPGAYDLVFDTGSRRVAGAFTFRYWVNDTTPPSVRLLTRTLRSGSPLRLTVRDGGSGVDPTSMLARVDRGYRRVLLGANGRVDVPVGRLARGRHSLLFVVADYQETKNTEDATKTLPNTRRYSTTFLVR